MLLDVAMRLWSWLLAHWKGVLFVLIAGGVLWGLWGLWASLDAYGDRRAAEAVLPWAQAAQKAAAAAGEAQAAADARARREAQAVAESDRRTADAEAAVSRLAADNAALLRRLRERTAAARRDSVPAAAAAAVGTPARAEPGELPGDDWLALAEAARRCADERERNVVGVREGRAAWPR